MAKLYSVALSKLIEDLKLETVYMPQDPQEIMIKTVDINRPGLQLCGFYDYFDGSRIQLFGLAEFAYMEKYTPQERQEFLDTFFSKKIPAVIITRNLDIPEEMVTAANTYGVPLLRTSQPTCDFMATMIATLKVDLAPRITRHGVLVEVYGEGILLLGARADVLRVADGQGDAAHHRAAGRGGTGCFWSAASSWLLYAR